MDIAYVLVSVALILFPALVLVPVIVFLEVRRSRRIRRGEPVEGVEIPPGGFEVVVVPPRADADEGRSG